ncbi:MAG TPA: DUF721 domain-containing protein [Actinomycetota bacterium]|nr:DUF721 domain-containing protein [Actinomycetota bacterium]
MSRGRDSYDDPVRLRDALGGATARFGLRDPVATGRLWAAWRDVVGPEIARRAEPTSLRDGVLRVRAESPAWATEIGYLADEIRRRADEVVGRGTVVEVRVWTGPPPDAAASGPSDPGAARAPDRAAPGRGTRADEPPAGAGDEPSAPEPRAPEEALRRAHEAWARARARRR